ncbi:Cation efflux system protein CusA [Granulosicoccus antarcticus IMCC3135]|uniref:Cation efflux system protein CusA n=2 Tax=Granulosicoccus TaxID=437504 RepID=A0A2Z2NQ09_9GAMM|nr:Cation efflux system protein CusA [Granulosicoccus antarcticus IMCC3135]
MTAVTIVAGLFPIMIGSGTGSEVVQGVAAPMVGGILSTTVLTMLVIPVVYFLWERRELKRLLVSTVDVIFELEWWSES